MYSFLTIYN